jgi:predicted aspartyl protease
MGRPRRKGKKDMGRIVTSVRVTNATERDKSLRCDALVDTGASYLVLPSAWKERLGKLDAIEEIELETATQQVVKGETCGPVEIQIEGFRPIYNEVVFVDMQPEDGTYEPLVGYIVLEQSQAAVDLVGHRLLHVKRMDLK